MKSRSALVATWLGLCAGSGVLALACVRGGADASADGGTCDVHVVLVADVERANPDETSCGADTDCVVAYEGDTCGCPYITPRGVTKAIAARIAERNDSERCTCPGSGGGCDASGPLPGEASCVGGKCLAAVLPPGAVSGDDAAQDR